MQYLGASQKQQNDLGSFPKQTTQHHSNTSLCSSHWCRRSWSWLVLWRPTRASRTNTKKRCPFHHRRLECQSRKSRDTWSKRQVWPWSDNEAGQRLTEFSQDNTHHFPDKGPYSQSYGFSSSHLWMWDFDHKEPWVPKNWCFRIVVLKKTIESPLDCKEIKPVNSKGNQP